MITTSEMVDSRDDNSPKTKEYAHTMANASKSDLELASNGTMNTIIPKATDHQLPLFAEHLHIDDPVSESALCSSDVAVSSFSSHAIIGFAGSSSDFASIDQESGNTEGSVSSSSIKLGQEEAGTVGEAVQEEENRDDEDDDGYGSTSTSKGLGFQMNRRYGDAAPDCDELRVLLAKALDEQKCNARCLIRRFRLSGVGELINHLRVTGGEIAGIKERIVLDRFGNKILRSSQSEDVPMTWSAHKKSSKSEDGSLKNSFLSRVPAIFRPSDDGSHSDLPPPPPHPADPIEIRKLVRSKMLRCKRCKNRFIEKNIYERHLRDKHPVEYLAFLIQQEEEIAEQRLAELEANRIEELATGGYIPPEDEIAAEGFNINVSEIPLPGELSGGVPARFDGQGFLRQPKRPYKKKVSPQCPFCDKRFRNEQSLKKHFVKKHPDFVEFVQCLRCFKALRTNSDLLTHDCDLSYMCFECTPMRNMCTQQRLFNHRAKFHRGANSGFKCNMCSLKFLTPRKLRKHKKMAHVFTKTYACHFCEELFTSECSVTTHERIHTGIIKFECRICDYKCNRFIRMEEHQKEEHGYICSVCQERCAEWCDLKNHTLNEHGGYLTSESNAGYIDSPRVWVMYKGE